MKKIKNVIIIILLCISFCLVNVKAETEAFKFAWENNKEKIISSIEDTTMIKIADNNYEFNNGYVTGKFIVKAPPAEPMEAEVSNQPKIESILTYYNEEGKEITKRTFDNVIILSVKSSNEDLYITILREEEVCIEVPSELGISELTDILDSTSITCGEKEEKSTEPRIEVYKLNTKLETVKQKDITNYIIDEENSNYVLDVLTLVLPKIIGYDNINVIDDKVAIIGGLEQILVLDKDLTNVKTEILDSINLKKYFPLSSLEYDKVKEFVDTASDNQVSLFISTESKNDITVSSGVFGKSSSNQRLSGEYGLYVKVPTEEGYDYIGYKGILKNYDKNNKELWSKEFTDYAALVDTHIIGDYIVSIGLKTDVPEDIENSNPEDIKISSDILVFDLEGNIVQKIADNSIYLGLFPTTKGFITTNINEFTLDLGNNEEEVLNWSATMNNKVYYLTNKINTKVTGEGEIKVTKTALPGDEIKFVITPKKGYELEIVKVTDKDGNVVTFTSNTFTMPSSDVTIEAIFIVANPVTKDAAIFLIASALIIGILVTIINHKKLKWLK